MSNINLQMQDHQGNILHPETDAELVKYKASNVNDVLVELEDREQVFVQEVEPADDGLWVDTSDQTVRPNEENPVVTQVKKHINHFKEDVTTQLNAIENKLVFFVEDFGAVGDGVSDDSNAILNAINTIASKYNSATLHLNKNYLINSEVVLNFNYKKINFIVDGQLTCNKTITINHPYQSKIQICWK